MLNVPTNAPSVIDIHCHKCRIDPCILDDFLHDGLATALDEDLEKGYELMYEVLYETDFSDIVTLA